MVVDGKIMTANLKAIGKKYAWLKAQVEKFNMKARRSTNSKPLMEKVKYFVKRNKTNREKAVEIMLKETIICVIIVALIVFGNYKLQDYTDETVSEITGELSKIREDLLEDGILKSAEKIDNEKLKTDIEEIHNRWTDRNEKIVILY